MTEQSPNRVPVLVVGAGPTGLAMAAELARHGVACRIIDKASAPTTLSKATSLQARTLEIFHQLGIDDVAIERGHKSHAVNVYAGQRHLVKFRYDDLDSPYPFMLSLIQSESEKVLGELVAQQGLAVERNVELVAFSQDGSGVHATLRHPDGREEALEAGWIIGCDGAHSTIRHTLQIPFEGETFHQWFALADASIRWSLPDDELHGFVHQKGLFFVIPLAPGQHRIIIEDTIHSMDYQPTVDDFRAALKERVPYEAEIVETGWLSAFHVNVRRAAKYRVGRAFVAGEAAHVHSPVGGQGLNTSVQDAHNLAWKLALVVKGAAPDSILDSYQPERQPVAESVLKATAAITRVITLENRFIEGLRDHVMPLMTGLPPVKAQMATQDAEIDITYRKSPIVEDHGGGHAHLGRMAGPQAGDRAPDAEIAPINGHTHFYDLLRGTKHTLLLFGGRHADTATWRHLGTIAEAIDRRPAELFQVYAVANGDGAAVPDGLPVLGDPTGALRHRYGADHPCLYLIRPDGYVGYRSHTPDLASLERYLGRIFTPTAEPAMA